MADVTRKVCDVCGEDAVETWKLKRKSGGIPVEVDVCADHDAALGAFLVSGSSRMPRKYRRFQKTELPPQP